MWDIIQSPGFKYCTCWHNPNLFLQLEPFSMDSVLVLPTSYLTSSFRCLISISHLIFLKWNSGFFLSSPNLPSCRPPLSQGWQCHSSGCSGQKPSSHLWLLLLSHPTATPVAAPARAAFKGILNLTTSHSLHHTTLMGTSFTSLLHGFPFCHSC